MITYKHLFVLVFAIVLMIFNSCTIPDQINNFSNNDNNYVFTEPMKSGTTSYQAENATLSLCSASTQYAGYTGTGYALSQAAKDAYVQFTVSVSSAGTYPVIITYSDASGLGLDVRCKVNSDTEGAAIIYPATSAWTTWSTYTYSLALVAGSNTIKFRASTSDGLPHIDKIDVVEGGTATTIAATTTTVAATTTTKAATTTTVSGATTTTKAVTTTTKAATTTTVAVTTTTKATSTTTTVYPVCPEGWAQGVDGAKEQTQVTVTSWSALKTAFARSDSYLTIIVSGTITIDSAGFATLSKSNRTIRGINNAKITGEGGVKIDGCTNVIVRNITFDNCYDNNASNFAWDSGALVYDVNNDGLGITNSATKVWVDHCTFTDGTNAPPVNSNGRYNNSSGSVSPCWLGSNCKCPDPKKDHFHHDGLMDITKGADYITVSYSSFKIHGKSILIGSSDSTTSDSGHLKTTFAHNYFDACNERQPRVRFGQVHLYNNYYGDVVVHPTVDSSGYCMGYGKNSDLISENNYFENVYMPSRDWSSGTGKMVDTGSTFINCANPISLNGTSGWTPSYTHIIDATANVKTIATTYAGAGKPIR